MLIYIERYQQKKKKIRGVTVVHTVSVCGNDEAQVHEASNDYFVY